MVDIITQQKLNNLDRDISDADKALNTKAVVTPRYGASFKSLPLAIQEVIETGGFEPFETEAQLLASTPTVAKKASIALNTGNIFLWENNAWVNSGMGLKAYSDSFSSLTKNSTVLYPFTTLKRNNVEQSDVGTNDNIMRGFVIGANVFNADLDKYYRIQQISSPTNAANPNRWTFEVLSKTDFDTKETSIKTFFTTFNIVANTGIKTFTVQDGDVLISITVDTAKTPSNNFYSVTSANYAYTYIIDPSLYIYTGIKPTEISASISDINTKLDKISSQNQIQLLLADLRNPIQSVQIQLIGDSITWGLGATGIAPTAPNDKLLTDARNNATSKTWANIFRDYLGTAFCTSSRFGDATITNDGTAYYTSNGLSVLSNELDNYKFQNSISKKKFTTSDMTKLIGSNTSASSGTYIDLIADTYTTSMTTRPNEFSFEFVGNSLTISYAKLAFGTEGNANAEVYVNGALKSIFSVYGTASFGHSFIVDGLPDGRNTIKIKNGGKTADVIVRIGTISATKKITVVNNGLSGSSTKTWLDNNLIQSAVSIKDDYIFMMLGTNDRHQTAKLGTYRNQYVSLINQILVANPNVRMILMSPPATTANEDPSATVYKFRIADINEAINQIAKSYGYSFISNFEPTSLLKTKGTTFLSDGLHPNDFGYAEIAENIIRNLTLA